MPANDYYDSTGAPATGSQALSSVMRAEFDLIEAGFNKMPALTGNGAKLVAISTGGTSLTTLAGVGTAGQVLTSNGAGSLPTFQDASGGILKAKAATVGANITLAGGAPSTLDGVSLSANDIIVVKDQSSTLENGVYKVDTVGSGSNGTWTRASAGDTWSDLVSLAAVVEQGTVSKDSLFFCTVDAGGSLGVTAVAFAKWSQSVGTGRTLQDVVFNTGNHNTAYGATALKGAAGSSTGTNNSAVGSAALTGITTGSSNVAMGQQAGQTLTTGGQNVLIGRQAGMTTAVGTNNLVAIGSNAGNNVNVTSPLSVFVGHESGLGNGGGTSVATNNTAVGYQALRDYTSGGSNTAVGARALTALTTGASNVAIGDGALDTITTGAGSIAIGHNTLGGSGINPTDAIAIGNAANGSTTIGNYSIAIGTSTVASAANAIAMGRSASADLIGKWSWNGATAANNIGRQGKYLLTRQTTDVTQTTLTTDDAAAGAANQIILPNNATYGFCIYIVARRTDVDDEGAFYKLEGAIDRNGNAASTALIGSVTKTAITEDTAAWDVEAVADTSNGGLNVRVTGENAKTIRWAAVAHVVEIAE